MCIHVYVYSDVRITARMRIRLSNGPFAAQTVPELILANCISIVIEPMMVNDEYIVIG